MRDIRTGPRQEQLNDFDIDRLVEVPDELKQTTPIEQEQSHPVVSAPNTEELAQIQDSDIENAFFDIDPNAAQELIPAERIESVIDIISEYTGAKSHEVDMRTESKESGIEAQHRSRELTNQLTADTGSFTSNELIATIDTLEYLGNKRAIANIAECNPTNKRIIIKAIKTADVFVPTELLEKWATDEEVIQAVTHKLEDRSTFYWALPKVLKENQDIHDLYEEIKRYERRKKNIAEQKDSVLEATQEVTAVHSQQNNTPVHEKNHLQKEPLTPYLEVINIVKELPYSAQLDFIRFLGKDVVSQPQFFETLATRIGDQTDLDEVRELVANASKTKDTDKIAAAVDIFNNLRIDKALEIAEQTGHTDISKQLSEKRLAA